MKITELITELNEILAEHGDVDVEVRSYSPFFVVTQPPLVFDLDKAKQIGEELLKNSPFVHGQVPPYSE